MDSSTGKWWCGIRSASKARVPNRFGEDRQMGAGNRSLTVAAQLR